VAGRTLDTMLGGRQGTRYKQYGEQFEVVVRVAKAERDEPTDISGIYVRARDGSMIQLEYGAQVSETLSPQSLNHFNRLRAVKIEATISPGYTMGEVLEHMNQVARDMFPASVQL